MINSFSKHFTFKLPERRLFGFFSLFSIQYSSRSQNRSLQRSQITQLLFQLVVESSDTKHARRIPVHTVSVESAGNGSWGGGNWDGVGGRQPGKSSLSSTVGD